MNRKIVLFIDNAGSHFNTKRLQKENSDDSSEDESDNEQGSNYINNKLNIKEAIDYIAEGWNNVTQKTIRNYWIKTGILPTLNNIEIESNNEEETHDEETDKEIDEEIINLLDNLPEKDC
ncbi:1397_t:CDS:2, partial [Diversispora eburnea]